MKSSETASLAASTQSQIQIKQETNQTKTNLKQLLKNVDQNKSGKIKTDVYF